MDFIINYENIIRLLCFIGFLSLFCILENLFPIYKRTKNLYKRWFINISFVFIDTILLRLVFPILAVGFAVICMNNNWGLFNIIELNIYLEFFLAFVLLDFGIWLQHVLFHKINFIGCRLPKWWGSWFFYRSKVSSWEILFSSCIRFY